MVQKIVDSSISLIVDEARFAIEALQMFQYLGLEIQDHSGFCWAVNTVKQKVSSTRG